MAKIINGRVRQKAAPLAEWQNSDLESLDGEQLFVRSDVDDAVIGFKFGAKGKKFSELPYPDLTVRDKATPSMSWSGRQSGVYIPTTNGNYNGVNVNLTEGYQVLYWDGATVQKVVYPADYTGAVFGGVIDDTYDLSTPPTDPTWYIASAGTYNTTPSTTLTETSILTWNGQSWSHIPFELEVRGEFLVADNIQEVRNITPEVAQLLVNGTYKGVTVLGYYEPGDTPGAINYYLSDTTDVDDGGSVIEIGSVKLEHDFNFYVDTRYYGLVGNGINETDQMQKAFNKAVGGIIFIANPKTEYLTRQIIIPSDVNVQHDTKVIWKATDDLSQLVSNFEVLFRFEDSKNVNWISNGAVYYMNKSAYSGEHNHIFALNRAENIYISGANANLSGGDGFFIGGLYQASNPTAPKHSKNITIVNCTAGKNRRQGMSVVGVDGILVERCKFYETGVDGGTAPQAGVDIEPNKYTDLCTNIVFRDCQSINNNGIGFELAYFNYDHPDYNYPVINKNNLNIKLENCYTFGNSHAYQTRGVVDRIKGLIQFVNCVAEESNFGGFVERGVSSSIKTYYENCSVINCNLSKNSARDGVYNSAYIVQGFLLEGVRFTEKIGNSEFKNCKAISNKESSGITRGVSFVNTHSSDYENNIFSDFEGIGLNTDIELDAEVVSSVKINRLNNKKVVSVINRTILSSETNKEFTNTGATGSVTYTLPQNIPGLEYIFRVDAPYAINITKGLHNVLGLTRKNTDAIGSSTVGDYLTIRSRIDGDWEVVNIKGRWGAIDLWTTSTRPTTGKIGDMGFNSTTGLPEWWNGTAWVNSSPIASPSVKGLVNQGVHVPDGSSIDTLLTSLRNAGIIASS